MIVLAYEVGHYGSEANFDDSSDAEMQDGDENEDAGGQADGQEHTYDNDGALYAHAF